MNEFTHRLAEVVIDLRNSGNTDPNRTEIINYLLEGDLFPNIFYGEVTKRFQAIKKIVASETGISTITLMNETYYKKFREKGAVTLAEAQMCLPGGNGVRPFGIRFAKGEDDLIFIASLDLKVRKSSGYMATALQNAKDGYDGGFISKKQTGRIIKDAHRRALPHNILKLEGKSEDE
jgi:hypothetical protein